MRVFVICCILTVILLSASRAETDGKPLALCDLHDLTKWQGLSPGGTITYNGAPAPKWAQSKSATASTDAIPHDWSGYNCLEFALYSEKATNTDFMLIVESEDPRAEGWDYFSMRIKLDWTGWQEFTVPFNELNRSRQPSLGKIDAIRFTAEGWGMTPSPEAVIHIAELRLSHLYGPQITDTELFTILDLDYPGLEKVRTAMQGGDTTAAKHELAEYLRDRGKPRWWTDWRARPKHESRPDGVDTKEADLILQRSLPSVGVRHKFEGKIDWNLDPMDYLEWPFQLNRHPFWVTLGQAYWATGEEKYAQEFVYQMLDWVASCPVPISTSGNAGRTWRTIEAGIRTGQRWPEAYHLFLTSPSFTDEAIITMVKSFVEHARHLMRWPTTGNWLTMEANGLMHCGVLFPEFKESAEWRKTATDRLYAELDRQVYPDGAQIELSTGYHQVSLNNFLGAWKIAHLNDVPMPADYVARIQRMYDYNLRASMPGGTLPGLNDAGRTDIRGQLRGALTYFPDRSDYEWMATDGKTGRKPDVGSVAFPFAGQLVMRSGWDKDDLYLMIDAGPFGYGHQHEDALNVMIYAHGRYHLIDPGNYAYNRSKWRAYVLSTRAHNTIMVDDLEQHRRTAESRDRYVISKPLPNKWIAGSSFDYARGSYDEGYGPDNQVRITHARNVFFVKPEYWVIADFLQPSDDKPHRYQSMFHLDAEAASADGALCVRTDNKDAANLAILPLAGDGLSVRVISGQEEPTVQGWVLAKGYDMRPIPTPVFEREKAGPTSFLYVFYPTKTGTACPITAVEPLTIRSTAGEQVAGAAIRFADGRTDYYIQAEKPGAKTKFLDFETDAASTFVRVENGKVTKAMLAGGTKLMRAGKLIPAEVREIDDLSKTEVRHKF